MNKAVSSSLVPVNTVVSVKLKDVLKLSVIYRDIFVIPARFSRFAVCRRAGLGAHDSSAQGSYYLPTYMERGTGAAE